MLIRPRFVVFLVVLLAIGFVALRPRNADGGSGGTIPVKLGGAVTDPTYEGRWLAAHVRTGPGSIVTDFLADRRLIASADLDGADLRTIWGRQLAQHDAWGAVQTLTGEAPVLGSLITSVTPGGPADVAGIAAGDVIVVKGSAPGVPATASLINATETGSVRVIVTRDGTTRETTVTAGSPAAMGAGRIEVAATTPPVWAEDDGTVGGSLGLILALAELDATTPGDLSGGQTISGNGTLYADGDVMAAAGATAKVRAAAADGADVFFIGDDGYGEAQTAAGGRIQVVQVGDVADAVTWLCEHGGRSTAC